MADADPRIEGDALLRRAVPIEDDALLRRAVPIEDGHVNTGNGWLYPVHTGVRVAFFAHPTEPGRVMVHLLGGAGTGNADDDDGIAVSISANGLRNLAHDMLAVVGALEVE